VEWRRREWGKKGLLMIASPTERDKLEAGVAAHRGGSAAEAERLYRAVLAAEPGNADALHLLGVLAGKPGRVGGFAEAPSV
jgi:hypothetical protein